MFIGNNKYLSAETKQKYKDTYNTLYCAEVISNAEFIINGTHAYYEFTYTQGPKKGELITTELTGGKKVKDDTIKTVAQNIKSPAVFRYNGKIYVKVDDNIIREAPNTFPNEVFDNNNTEFID